jgi:tetratricopeptide (TPR) repeat protein
VGSRGLCAGRAQAEGPRAGAHAADGALALEPTHHGALFAHAWLNKKEGRLAEAVTDYTALLAAEPPSTTALNNRAWVKVVLGDFEGARADADRAVESAESQGSALHLGTQCFALAGLGERAAAKAACEKALERARAEGVAREAPREVGPAPQRGVTAQVSGA